MSIEPNQEHAHSKLGKDEGWNRLNKPMGISLDSFPGRAANPCWICRLDLSSGCSGQEVADHPTVTVMVYYNTITGIFIKKEHFCRFFGA